MANYTKKLSKQFDAQIILGVKSRMFLTFCVAIGFFSLLSSACRADEPFILSSYRPAEASERVENHPAEKAVSSIGSTRCHCPTKEEAQEKAGETAEAPKAEKEKTTHSTQIEINSATTAELVSLPGIGPATAQKIISYREKRRFRKKSDLTRIKGIGRATLRKLEPLITVSDQ